jgi:hypothetical protein
LAEPYTLSPALAAGSLLAYWSFLTFHLGFSQRCTSLESAKLDIPSPTPLEGERGYSTGCGRSMEEEKRLFVKAKAMANQQNFGAKHYVN